MPCRRKAQAKVQDLHPAESYRQRVTVRCRLWLCHVDCFERVCYRREMANGLRETNPFGLVLVADKELSLAPLISLVMAALLILAVRRIFRISRWHGPADSIYAAHRTDNELDIRAGFGSTLAAFISASGGASVGQYGPLVHFGATMGSSIRRVTGGMLTTDVFIGCGWPGDRCRFQCANRWRGLCS